jgi:hypothetical protein
MREVRMPYYFGGHSEFSVWRKIVIGVLLGLWLVLGGRLFNWEADIYVSAPHDPVAATRQTSPVHVNHGSLRFVTPKEAEDLSYWRNATSTTIGISALTIVFLALTRDYRIGKRRRSATVKQVDL